ncbi:DedA family inner membrane protein YqjA [Salmonella enterica subsp. enterica]|nr:DedA family inner membrane protein YqjA [Salmonella enterica subsp. enterica]
MELLTQLLNALWAQDFETLANPSMIGMLYFVLFMILFLENGLLPGRLFAWRQPVDPGRRADRQRRDGVFHKPFCCLPSRPAWVAG